MLFFRIIDKAKESGNQLFLNSTANMIFSGNPEWERSWKP
jgi:hypothetical protein